MFWELFLSIIFYSVLCICKECKVLFPWICHKANNKKQFLCSKFQEHFQSTHIPKTFALKHSSAQKRRIKEVIHFKGMIGSSLWLDYWREQKLFSSIKRHYKTHKSSMFPELFWKYWLLPTILFWKGWQLSPLNTKYRKNTM